LLDSLLQEKSVDKKNTIIKMPGITQEWKHYSNDNTVNYNIRIFDFGQKMKNWRAGREVRSMPFKVGDSEFSINIYPNGSSKGERGNISFYVNNKNDWDVMVEVEFSIGSKSLDFVKQIPRFQNWGWGEFCDHEDIRNLIFGNDADESLGEALTASAKIKLIWEEITSETKTAKEEVLGLKSEVTDLKRKIETLESTMISKLESIKNPVEKKCTSPCPECPICFDEMKPPTKIVQCMSGHLICLKCRDRPEISSCPTCKQRFTGERAVGMEKFLRALFPEEQV